mmetsp:Transcript_3526/g.8994  ORF Transcript_3526/g.8994 Transcript_3526/m.8994 type:complete len:836 (-) Transcript_3526:1456-3963(-)|eukprot:CAMPEP_0181137828 /NCGR_PEP_ID=MMETSP1071-20121207/33908_1 /TAXON_ID=35127 /ORGANISM="Thalassiosira sp., Strain NH16" /LENGTH=835 /DNA_ID=CAMNT_0023224597 /DNA_START=156 /DNA_END=2663 /DNA_ORIENTATION=-
MASPLVQLNSGGPALKKKKRAVISPTCVGGVLLVMYVVFVYLVLTTYEDSPGRNSGAAHHLTHSVVRSGTTPPEQPSSERKGAKVKNLNQQSSESSQQPMPAHAEHLEVHTFCGECIWKDTLFHCDERVKWEMENKGSTEIEAKKKNLLYCTKPHEQHVSEFCGQCQWKDTEISCDERVAWEVKNKEIPIIEAQKRNLVYCKVNPYTLSPLCGGCVRSLSNMTSKMYRFGVPCYDIMLRRLKRGNAQSLDHAATLVAEEFEECRICHPRTCWKNYFDELSLNPEGLVEPNSGYLTKYWRFDSAAPKFSSPTTLVLSSIPQEFRIPPSRFADIEAYLIEKYNEFESSNDTKHVEIFIEYNPGLAAIPSKMKQYLPQDATYAVVFRVTPANNCFARSQMEKLPKKVWEHTLMSATNLLGIALLDKHYNMLEGYDVVLDPATQLECQKDGYGTTYFGEPTFMDYRLFTLNDELYLHANADVTVVTKLDLRSKMHSRKAKKKVEFKLDVLYGENNLEVTMLHQFNTIWSGGDRGKNFALFSVPNITHPDEPDSTYAEVHINPYHEVQQIYLDDVEMQKRSVIKKRIRRNWTVDKIMMRKVRTNGNLTKSQIGPSPSFFTVDEHWFPGTRPAFREKGHGGACCVSLSREEALAGGDRIVLSENSWGENNDYLLVGVAHTSVIWRRWYSDKNIPDSEKAKVPHTHYVSFFYAFEPRPPFNLRARSGYFCLGFAGEDGTEGGMFNPHSTLTANRKLSQHNETFSCPQIHFVSSFIEKVGDASTSIIGYGINDCTPRLVEVEKTEIARLLFSHPFEMKMESTPSQDAKIMGAISQMELPMGYA